MLYKQENQIIKREVVDSDAVEELLNNMTDNKGELIGGAISSDASRFVEFLNNSGYNIKFTKQT